MQIKLVVVGLFCGQLSRGVIDPIFIATFGQIVSFSQSPEKVRPHSSNSFENGRKGDPIIVSRVVKMRPHLAAHSQ